MIQLSGAYCNNNKNNVFDKLPERGLKVLIISDNTVNIDGEPNFNITNFKYELNAINFTHIAKVIKTILVLKYMTRIFGSYYQSANVINLSEFKTDHIKPLLLYSLVQLKMQVIILNAMRLPSSSNYNKNVCGCK